MKKLIAILMALCLCLTFAACSNEEEELSKGDKMYKKYKELINFLEEGDFEAASDALSSIAGEDLGNTDFGELQEIFDYLQNENYTDAIAAIVRLENSKNQKEPTNMMELLCRQWYGATYEYEQMPVNKTVSFNADGTCVILDETLNWIIESEYDTTMYLKVYKDGTAIYNVTLNINEYDRSSLSIYDIVEENSIGTFYEHTMMHYLTAHSWNRLDDTYEELPESFSVNLYDFYCDNDDYEYKIVSDPAEAELQIEAYKKNNKETRYIVRIYVRDGRYVTDLTDTTTNATTLYYSNYTGGYSTDWIEYLYNCANTGIKDFLDNRSFHFEGEYYRNNAARAKVYELLARCKGYKDADALLSKFIILEKMISTTKITFVDNLGNENTRSEEDYSFDAAGRLLNSHSKTIEFLLFGSYGANGYNYGFTYGEDGRISSIRYGHSSSVEAYLTPTYDENGRIISMEVRTNSATYTNTYTYDEDGKLIRADFGDEKESYNRFFEFIYDVSGKVVKIVGKLRLGYNEPYEFEMLYNYSEGGHIVSKELIVFRSKTHSFYTDWTIRLDFTCDDAGDPISAVISGTEYTDYASVTENIHYEDLYFYVP